jgi:hypothetical protein
MSTNFCGLSLPFLVTTDVGMVRSANDMFLALFFAKIYIKYLTMQYISKRMGRSHYRKMFL